MVEKKGLLQFAIIGAGPSADSAPALVRVLGGNAILGRAAPLASRSNTRFQKRLKELARASKRRDKEEKKQQRKSERITGEGGPPVEAIDPVDLGLPPLDDEAAAKGAATTT